MKKSIIYFAVACFIISFSACTKEQTTINTLHGTWKLTSILDPNGQPYPVGSCTSEKLVTFFLCTDKEQGDCEGTTKTTTTCTIAGSTTTTITSGRFGYSVYGKDQLVWGSTNYEIESIKKKDLVIHPVNEPKATETYEKQ
jgi:hypothetical protein